MFFKELCERKSIGTVLCHSQVQALQTEIKKEGTLGRLGAAEIAHELRCGFGDECAGQAEALGIDESMVAFIRSGQTGKFFGVCSPVEVAGVDDAATYRTAVTVHVFGGGVRHDVCAPFERAAVDRRGKRVVDNEWHTVGVSRLRKAFDIEHIQSGIGDGFAKERLGVGTKGGFEFFGAAVGRQKSELNTHLLHRDGKKVIGAAVNGGKCNHMIARVGDIENGKKVGCLT